MDEDIKYLGEQKPNNMTRYCTGNVEPGDNKWTRFDRKCK